MPGKHRKHTPIVSRQQQKFFAVELEKKKEGEVGNTGMTQAELTRHLQESRGKRLPRIHKKRR